MSKATENETNREVCFIGHRSWSLVIGHGHGHGGDGVLYRNEDASKLDGHQSPRDNALQFWCKPLGWKKNANK